MSGHAEPYAARQAGETLSCVAARRKQWGEGLLVRPQDHACVAHVAELRGKAQPVGRTATLTDD